ncbi:MAG: hypothetical protein WD960_06730 [Gemmatimonadota bacterium]
MKHLSEETLARLGEDLASPEEAAHLEGCEECLGAVAELRAQVRALGALPAMRPPTGEWEALEARMRSEMLLGEVSSQIRIDRGPPGPGAPPTRVGRGNRWRRSHGAGALRAAAAVALLAVGTGMGMSISSLQDRAGPGDAAPGGTVAMGEAVLSGSGASLPIISSEEFAELSLEEAEQFVRLTEGWYRESLARYRGRLEAEGRHPPSDPYTRYAALETLLLAGEAAVREAPADPFFNGLLVNVDVERQALLEGFGLGSADHNWY